MYIANPAPIERGRPPKAASVRHLAVVAESVHPVPRWRRWVALALAAVGVIAFVLALGMPWWNFTLYAPQYPHGLRLHIALTGLSGDVHEIDMLNHYIGMGHLGDAAQLERQYAAYGVAGVGVLVIAGMLAFGRRLGRLVVVPAALFPIGFVVDSCYWLYAFGHRLDPHAPLHVSPFTPQMFGNGQIGQFMTFAQPASGFWLSLLGVAAVTLASEFRARAVCDRCTRRATCGWLCPSGFVGREQAPGAGR